MRLTRRYLYVGSTWDGSTARARMQALTRLGVDVTPFDVSSYLRNLAFVPRQLASRWNKGSAIRRLNVDLVTAVRTHGSRVNCIWVDKGSWLMPETLQELRALSGAVLVHYSPDPQVTYQTGKMRKFIASIPLYDLIITTKPFEMAAYRQYGAREVHLINQSYCDERLRPRAVSSADRSRLGSEVCFIGRHEPSRVALIRKAMSTGAQVRVWGPHWRRWLWRHRALKTVFAGDGLWGNDYALALNATSIGLCFLAKCIPETTTTRTFEIPGSGTFMLAERTDDHLALFEEGREAEFFGDSAELADKVRYYLAHPNARQRIAAAGLARCQRSGYSDSARLKTLLPHLDTAYVGRLLRSA